MNGIKAKLGERVSVPRWGMILMAFAWALVLLGIVFRW